MNGSTLDTLQGIFRDVFADESLAISAQTTARDVRGWDSLSHMHLIAEVEAFFGIRFSFDEVRTLQNVGDLVRLVDNKRSA